MKSMIVGAVSMNRSITLSSVTPLVRYVRYRLTSSRESSIPASAASRVRGSHMPPPEMAEVPPNRSETSSTVTCAPPTADRSAAIMPAPPEPTTTTSLSGSLTRSPARRAARHLAERDVVVPARLPGHPEEPLAHPVARHLDRAAADLPDLAHEELHAHLTQHLVLLIPRDRAGPRELEVDRGQLGVDDPGQDARHARRLVVQPLGGDAARDPGAALLAGQLERVRLADQLPGHRVGQPAGQACHGQRRGRPRVHPAHAARRADEVGRDAQALLVVHPPGADRPAAVDLADPVGVGAAQVGQELLAELPGPVEHLDPEQV